MLLAMEKKNGTPLIREQVIKICDEGTCIAMNHRDAINLEKKRGYADIDPEYAWEQWQIVRELL